MKYKYKRSQLFGKRLNVPKEILKKVYNSTLSFNDYIKYELDDKIPISCIKESERKIVEKFGIEKCKNLDWELINDNNLYAYINIKEILMSIDSKTEDINRALYELVKNKIEPWRYSKRMKEVYSNRLFEISENESDVLRYFKEEFNHGSTTLTDLISNWNLVKDKDVSYCLLNDEKNKDSITDKELKEFMSNYGNIARAIMYNNNIYTVIKTISNFATEEEKKEYMKQITDDILDKSLKETNKYDYNLGLSNKEYAEIFKYSSIKDYLTLINDGYPPTELIEEIQRLPINYIANMSIPFSELNNYDVRRFIEKYGLKNVADFDNECGYFFSSNNCEMLKIMQEMYLHYGTFETRSNTDRPYTKDEFYEAMRRMIINGPTNAEYINKAPDYREMTGEFRKRNQDLFISEEAPEELQTLFYTKSLTPHNIKRIIETNPDCIKYLTDKDLSRCFRSQWINIGSEKKFDKQNLYSFLQSKTDIRNVIEFISEYRDILDIIKELEKEHSYKTNLEIDDNFEEIRKKMGEVLKEYLIRGERSAVDKTIHIPDQIKKEYPDIFLPDNVSEGMKFYWNNVINGNKIDKFMNLDSNQTDEDDILNNMMFSNVPNWAKDTLKQMNLEVLFHYYPIYITEKDKIEQINLVKYIKNKFGDEALNIMLEYGSYLYDITKNHNKNLNITLDMNYDKNKVLNSLDRLILKEIISSGIKYNDQISPHFKKNNPTLFLSENTPLEIRKKFYNREFTLEDFNKNPDLIKIFGTANVVCGFSEKLSWMIPLLENSENLKTTNYNRLKVISIYSKIQDINHQNAFKHFIENHFDNININNIEEYGYILQNIKNYNDIEKYLSNIKEKNKDILMKDMIEIFSYSNSGWITELIQVDERISYMDILKIISINENVNDIELKKTFKEYITNNRKQINMGKFDSILEILLRLEYSNSIELSSFKSNIAFQLLNTDDPIGNLEKIEKVFLKNNLPLCGKMIKCFQILYPKLSEVQEYPGGPKRFPFDDSSRIAPSLKDESLPNVGFHASNDEKRMIIIFNDLLRASYRSNERSLVEYINNIDRGNSLYLQLKENNFDTSQLTNEDRKELEIFVSHLEVLYENTQKGKKEEIDISNLSLEDKLRILSKEFKETKNYDLRDRIVRSFCYMAGISSFDELKTLVESSRKEQQKRIDKFIKELEDNNGIFKLQEGDFIRGIGGLEALSGSLGTGNFCKEQLGSFKGESKTDTTPLDVDLTLVTKTDSIYNAIEGTPTGFGFGNIYVVMKKDNPNLYISRDKEGKLTGEPYNPRKIEVFGSSVEEKGYETHWGARTGISLADVDCIIYKKQATIDSKKPYNEDGSVNYIGDSSETIDDLPAIKFEIAKNGYYIPVVDFSGKLIFTKEEFDKLREKMQGLNYYGEKKYKLSNDLITPEVEQIAQDLNEDSVNYTTSKRNKINNIIKEVLDELGLDIKTQMDGDLSAKSVEFIDTGSTGRNTNIPYDGDFDFYMRLDAEIMRIPSTLASFKNLLIKKMQQYGMKNYMTTDKGDLRFKKVQIDEETTVDIDISFGAKTNKIRYSSDECLKDRLKTIKELYPDKYKYVVANIILAKNILKSEEVNAYKPRRTDENQGGLGGVGVENWILQNGGSFIEACKSFKEAALDKNGNLVSFDEFKKKYEIWDFGENHFAARSEGFRYLHDNFVADNMNEIGYKKMAKAILEYLKTIELNQNQTTGIKR